MDEATRRISLRAAVAMVAVVAIAAVIWAASALAAGDSATGENGARDSPAPASVESVGEAPDEDCPNREGESGPSSDI